MGDIVERLRDYKPFRLGEGEWFGPAICTEAADLIESLRAENARLTEERDALVEAVEAAFECHMIPKSSAREGGAVKHVVAAQVADMFRDALAKVKGAPDAR